MSIQKAIRNPSSFRIFAKAVLLPSLILQITLATPFPQAVLAEPAPAGAGNAAKFAGSADRGCVLRAIESGLKSSYDARPKRVSEAAEIEEYQALHDLRLDEIFKEMREVTLAAGHREVRHTLNPEEMERFKKAWDRYLLLHRSWVNPKVIQRLGELAKAPDITADTLSGKYRNATLGQVVASIINDRLKQNRRMVVRIFQRSPRDLWSALVALGVLGVAESPKIWWTNFSYGFVNNFGPAGINAWVKVLVQDATDRYYSGGATRRRNQIQSSLNQLTTDLKAAFRDPVVQPQARMTWMGFQFQYANLYKALNQLKGEKPTITPSGAAAPAPATSDEATLASAKSDLDTAEQHLTTAQQALTAAQAVRGVAAVAAAAAVPARAAAAAAAAAPVVPADLDRLKIDVDTATHEYVKALASFTFDRLSQTPPDKDGAAEPAGTTAGAGMAAGQKTADDIATTQFSKLAEMTYMNNPGGSPFKDFVQAFIGFLPKPDPRAGAATFDGDDASGIAAMSHVLHPPPEGVHR